MIRLARLGHFGLRVRELEGAVRYYTEVVGLTWTRGAGGHAWLSLATGGPCVYLVAEEGPPLHHLGFELRTGQKVGAAAEELRAAGVAVSHGSADPGGHGETIRFVDPDGQLVEVYEPPRESWGAVPGPALRPTRLQHLVLQTPQVARAAAFYTERLGFRISDWLGQKFVWLRCGTDHHDVAIVYAHEPGMDHFAYEITGWAEVKDWCDLLARRGIRLIWGPGRHGPGNNLFVMFLDPEGNRVELSCEMEQFYDESVAYRPREWNDVAFAINLWGPGPTWRA